MGQPATNRSKTVNGQLQQEAERAHGRGWALTPLTGKKPVLKGWTKAEHPSLNTVRDWAVQYNLAVRTGEPSGVVVVDDDTEDSSAAETLGLPKTVTAITGGGGRHYYFKAPDCRVPNSNSKVADDVDIKGDGGAIVLPGSIHPDTGKAYRWAPGLSPEEVELAELPQQLLDLAVGKKRRGRSRRRSAQRRSKSTDPIAAAVEAITSAAEGTRNDTLFREVVRLAGDASRLSVKLEDLSREAVRAAVTAGLEQGEAEATVESAIKTGQRNASERQSTRHQTDTGNAERLVDRFGDDLRYCDSLRTFLIWDRSRWAPDETREVIDLAKQTVRAIYAEAADCQDPNLRSSLVDWAISSESERARKAMVNLARSERQIVVRHDQLDSDIWLLNCQNGTIDLRTGELRRHCRDDLITRVAPVAFDPQATCPRWHAFLEKILPSAAVRDFVRRAVGYSLSGDVREQVLFFCHGPLGQNGKSTFVFMLQELLGSGYAIQAAPDLLLAQKNRSHPTELADLFRVRLAVCNEMEEDCAFDQVRLKRLTGGDRIRARRMRQDFWEFDPSHKIWVASNHRPYARSDDDAVWRRLPVIPFDVRIPDAERDRGLLDVLRGELPGILAWAVQGCLEWQERGLHIPDEVLTATSTYRQEVDAIGQFLDECCIIPSPGAKATSKELYRAYRRHCDEVGEMPVSRQAFGASLTRRKIQRGKSGGQADYRNIRLGSKATRRGEHGEDGEHVPH